MQPEFAYSKQLYRPQAVQEHDDMHSTVRLSQVPDKIAKIIPPGSDELYVTQINHVCMKLILELKELSQDEEDGQPSVLATNYLVNPFITRPA